MADDDFPCCASGTHEAKGSPMSEQAQVGDTVRLTFGAIEGPVTKHHGLLYVGGYIVHGANRTVEILSRATPPLPGEVMEMCPWDDGPHKFQRAQWIPERQDYYDICEKCGCTREEVTVTERP